MERLLLVREHDTPYSEGASRVDRTSEVRAPAFQHQATDIGLDHKPTVPLERRKRHRQQRLQPFRAEPVGRLPERDQRLADGIAVATPLSASRPGPSAAVPILVNGVSSEI
jgi:hypothetical protein